MRFSLRSLLELMSVVAVAFALWRCNVVSYRDGREEMYREFLTTGVIERPSYGAIVPLEDHMNMHIITKWRPKPGQAIVEIWDCSTNWHPVLLRSVDVDVSPADPSK